MSNANHYRQGPTEWNDWPGDRRAQVLGQIIAATIVVGLIVGINLVLFTPSIRNRVDHVVLRVQTQVKKMRPHDRYVPTPVPTSVPTISMLGAQVTNTPRTLTATPTATQTLAPTVAPTPTLETTPLPTQVQLENDCYEAQGWNNCGPATLSMALRFYGWAEDQYAVAAVTKPDKNDKNVSPEEMVVYAYSLGDKYALMGYATDIEVLKLLLSNDFPVIVETWFIPEPDDEMGHYRLLTGYDDTTQQFTTQDSYNGADQPVPYDELQALWKVFNRVYVVVCEAERAKELSALLGTAVEPDKMYRNALAVALAETATNPEDKYAWFNAGTNYVGMGEHEKAAEAYDKARMLNLPWRTLWYQFGPFEAYLHVGRYQDVIALTDATLEVTNNLEESYYYRALARRALGDDAGARADLEKALQYNPLFERAAEALGE
jgi:tetratricopeptide (TPR) repeat protein